MGVFFLYNACTENEEVKARQALLEKRKQAWRELDKAVNDKARHFNGILGVVIRDLDTNWEISLNKDMLLPSASLVKIPVMLSCFYAEADGKISIKDGLAIKGSQRVAGSKVLGNFPAGSKFTVEELFAPMITQSDNTAANALIDLLGFDSLNAYFKKMGLKNTNIARNMMDFEERKEGQENYTTAYDMAYLLDGLYNRQFLSKEVSEKCLVLLGEQKINDRIPRMLPQCEVFVAHKTGLERQVCHDVGIVYTKKGNFLICVLVKHTSRFAKPAKIVISDIALLTYNYYQGL